eukprot:5447224-Amphidinium_carterae.1
MSSITIVTSIKALFVSGTLRSSFHVFLLVLSLSLFCGACKQNDLNLFIKASVPLRKVKGTRDVYHEAAIGWKRMTRCWIACVLTLSGQQWHLALFILRVA